MTGRTWLTTTSWCLIFAGQVSNLVRVCLPLYITAILAKALHDVYTEMLPLSEQVIQIIQALLCSIHVPFEIDLYVQRRL